MRDLRSREKHGRSIWTRRGARATSDTSRRFHCQIGVMFGNQDRVRLWRGACARGNESTGLHNAVQGAAINHQIFHKRERSHAKRLNGDRLAIAKLSHIKLAYRARMIGSVWLTVDRERASAADTFAAIRLERDWFLSVFHQSFIEDVKHFEKRGVLRNIAHFVIDEFTWRFWVRLPPNSQLKVHSCRNGRDGSPSRP